MKEAAGGAYQLQYNDIVVVTAGPHAGRVGVIDDEELDQAIVFFGVILLTTNCHVINPEYLRLADVSDLLERQETIGTVLMRSNYGQGNLSWDMKYDLLSESLLITDVLATGLDPNEHWLDREGTGTAPRVFLSHSSADKPIARTIRHDLLRRGYNVWIDEQEIRAGESIPVKVSSAINLADFVLVLLSRVAVESRWVQKEWAAKLSEEISMDKVAVIPLLLESCSIPSVLRDKKYADFSENYKDGLSELTKTLVVLSTRHE